MTVMELVSSSDFLFFQIEDESGHDRDELDLFPHLPLWQSAIKHWTIEGDTLVISIKEEYL